MHAADSTGAVRADARRRGEAAARSRGAVPGILGGAQRRAGEQARGAGEAARRRARRGSGEGGHAEGTQQRRTSCLAGCGADEDVGRAPATRRSSS